MHGYRKTCTNLLQSDHHCCNNYSYNSERCQTLITEPGSQTIFRTARIGTAFVQTDFLLHFFARFHVYTYNMEHSPIRQSAGITKFYGLSALFKSGSCKSDRDDIWGWAAPLNVARAEINEGPAVLEQSIDRVTQV